MRTGDVIKVECEADKAVPGVEINVVLVQAVEKYAGSNGIVFHKMVVRDLAVLPAGSKSAAFDLAASEKAADEYLTNFEKTSTRRAPAPGPCCPTCACSRWTRPSPRPRTPRRSSMPSSSR